MTLPAQDNFNRADGALGSNWTGSVGADLMIDGQRVTGASASYCAQYWSAGSPNEGQYAQCNFATASSGSYAAVFVRGNASDFVMLLSDANGGSWSVCWYNDDAWTQIGSTYATGPADGDIGKITASGSNFEGFINGTSRITGSNGSAPSTGSGGLFMNTQYSDWLDDFEVGNLSTAPVLTAVQHISHIDLDW